MIHVSFLAGEVGVASSLFCYSYLFYLTTNKGRVNPKNLLKMGYIKPGMCAKLSPFDYFEYNNIANIVKV